MGKKPFVIAVFHQKGGVGKTTAVIQLAVCRIAKDHKNDTLLMDLDPSGSLTVGLGLIDRQNLSSLDLLLGNMGIEDVVKPTKYPRLKLIPSHPDLALVPKFLYVRPRYSFILKDLLNNTKLNQNIRSLNKGIEMVRRASSVQNTEVPWIFLDCPPMINPITSVALTAADLLLIPVTADPYSIAALDKVFRFIEAIQQETNESLDFRLFVNMFDKKSPLQNHLLEKIRKKFGDYVFDTVIGVEPMLEYAQMAGEPLFALSTKTDVTRQFISLAQEINIYVKTRFSRG